MMMIASRSKSVLSGLVNSSMVLVYFVNVIFIRCRVINKMNEQKCFRTIIHLVYSLFARCKHSLDQYVVVINNKHKKRNKNK